MYSFGLYVSALVPPGRGAGVDLHIKTFLMTGLGPAGKLGIGGEMKNAWGIKGEGGCYG